MRLTGRTLAILAGAAFASAGALGASALLLRDPGGGAASRPIQPAWTETPWPFPLDPWGRGKAFLCKAADCGGEVRLFVRAKLGFCNCATGIADDEDLDRMGDLDLLGGQAAPLGPGRPVAVGSMQGRIRAHSLAGAQSRDRTVLSIAFNDRCDMVTATALLAPNAPPAAEPAVMDFLNSAPTMKWVEAALGL